MAASPEFYKPPAAPPAYAYPPRLLISATEPDPDEYFSCCRTPTGAGIGYLGEPATCPPAPRKPRPPPASACRKRLFDVGVISIRFDDLESIFRPAPSPSPRCDNDKEQRRRSSGRLSGSRSGGGAILS